MNSMTRILLRKAVPGFISDMLAGAGFMLFDPETPGVFMGVSGFPGTIMYLVYCGLYGAAGLTFEYPLLYRLGSQHPSSLLRQVLVLRSHNQYK
ncbi:MAG: hypothetical protein Q4F96_04210 [Bacillota bacterium]|nr:hypothetical protein [Bacillota bacterium]